MKLASRGLSQEIHVSILILPYCSRSTVMLCLLLVAVHKLSMYRIVILIQIEIKRGNLRGRQRDNRRSSDQRSNLTARRQILANITANKSSIFLLTFDVYFDVDLNLPGRPKANKDYEMVVGE